MTDINFLEYVEVIHDWPEQGSAVCDVSRLLEHPNIFHEAVVALAKPFVELQPNKVVGIGQRGIALASAVAYYLGCGIVPAFSIRDVPEDCSRKMKWLPASRFADAKLGLVAESIDPGDRIIIIDDWLIKGKTVFAVLKAIKKLKASVVGVACVINNLSEASREKLGRPEVYSLIKDLEPQAFKSDK
jgi:adenine phosphoribosyltransferase